MSTKASRLGELRPRRCAIPLPPVHGSRCSTTRFAIAVALLASGLVLDLERSPLWAQEPGDVDLVTEDVRYESGGVTLAALYLRPDPPSETGSAIPGAVMIQGSGDSGRDNAWSRMIAETIARAGFGVLLTDKRGVGPSEGDWRSVGFHALADDAAAGVAYLASRPEVDPESVGLVGLSQGGWVAPIAAASSDRIAFVVNVSGASVSFAEQSFHEMANTARQEGLPPEQVRQVLELNQAAARFAHTGRWEPYGRLLDEAVRGPWAPLARGFPQSPDEPRWEFIRNVMDFGPLPYWIMVDQPVLVLYGEEDERDNVPVAESVRRLESAFAGVRKENHRIVVIPGADHGFLDFSSDDHAEHGLRSDFVQELTRWLSDRALD